MKKIFLVILVLIHASIVAQSVSGTVVDENNEPLPGATVYFDGSSYGTTTNMEGKFRITIPSQISSSLIVSFVGFEKVYLNNLSFNEPYKIILKENVESLKEIVVSNNIFSRKQMMTIFRNQFLGTTKAGKKCKIENENEIYFSYDKDSFTLFAYADKPLLINNPFLGYKVYFELNKFSTKFRYYTINPLSIYSSYYDGSSRFEVMDNSKKRIENRENIYKGSSLELFRNIAHNKWSIDGFVLFEKSMAINAEEHLQAKDTLGKKLILIKPQVVKSKDKDFVAEFNFLYKNKEQSKIIFNTPFFTIDEYGLYSNYDKIYFSGDLAKRKVGDLLPSNYGID
jgi:hypothetical protein